MKIKELNLANVDLSQYELLVDPGSYLNKADSKFYFKGYSNGIVTLYDTGFWEVELDALSEDFLELNLGPKLKTPLSEMIKKSRLESIKLIMEQNERNLQTVRNYLKDLE